ASVHAPSLRIWNGSRRRGSGRGEHLSRLGDALQLMHPAILEGQARARDEIAYGARDVHVARSGQRRDARRGVNGDAADRAARELDLSRVHSRPQLEAELLPVALDRTRASDGACGAVEAREQAIPGGVDLDPGVRREV